MYKFPIKLQLRSGGEATGIAMNTGFNGEREECVVIEHNEKPELIALDSISSLRVLVDNPHLDFISFE